MAKLYFKYGTLKAGKSIEILQTVHNYESVGKRILLYTSAKDNRSGIGVVASRVGLEKSAIPIQEDEAISQAIARNICEYGPLDCVLIDEAQFLTSDTVRDLAWVVDRLEVPVITYGLKNDFQNNLFEGSQALLAYADRIEEIKSVCVMCNKKAIMNLRTAGGEPVYEGEQIQIGDEEYLPVCRKHYYNPIQVDKKE